MTSSAWSDLVRLEISKTVVTRGRVLLLVAAGLATAGLMVTTALVEDRASTLAVADGGFAVLGVALPVLAVVLIAHDWQSGGMHFTTLRFPHRGRVWAVKLGVLLAAVVLAVVGTVLTSVALAGAAGAGDASFASALGWSALPVLGNTVLAAGLASLILRTGPAVVAFVLVSSVLGPVAHLVLKDGLGGAARWLQYEKAMAALGSGTASGLDLAALALLIGLPLVAGAVAFRRRTVD